MKNKFNLKYFLRDNNVTVLFIILCIGAYFASGATLTFLLPELFTRIGRNTFMVLSLLIPVIAGLGLNFGIVIGAIAAQISIFIVMLIGVTGLPGLLLCAVISTPLAIFFGYLIGRLFNSMKGTEMIGGLVCGYFSDGLYQLLFLFVLGGIIPIANKTLMISTGVGVKNAINLEGSLKYALDNVAMISILDFAFYAALVIAALVIVYRLIKKQDLKIISILKVVVPIVIAYGLSYIPFVNKFLSSSRLLLLNAIEISVVICVLYNIYKIIRKSAVKKRIIFIIGSGVLYAATYIPALYNALIAVRLPVLTYICIGALSIFISWFMNTKLGQEMRTVGQSRSVANSAGINVDKTRIIAMIMSTVLASYGHIISLQNIGTVATYGAHQQVGLYAIAALLVGGASINKANAKQAILGIILFHTLFILSPVAGKELLGNAQIGEYFRVFVAYGVIALSLALHAWSKMAKSNQTRADNKAKDQAQKAKV
ncbi:MAG: ABC transporter permease subunit [Suipraeoptans sp.]